MDRPTVFLSSTIYDFRDLRSALKDYLEARGCVVNASEFNDFDKPLDKHSYDACLAAIERSDYFLLLIGSRVGGWFSAPDKVSITRAEYRHAYELAKKEKLKILTFVRDEVWTHRQGVKELRTALKAEAELSDDQRRRIANHATAYASDAETVIAFIEEVCKNTETAAASRGEGPMPVANWVHTFKTFADIREAVDLLVLNGQSVDVAARKKALQAQLLGMLQAVVPSFDGKPVQADATILRMAHTLSLKAEDLTSTRTLSKETWGKFAMLAMLASKPRPEVGHFRQVLMSDLLLRYDPSTSSFRETPEYDLLADIIVQGAVLGLAEGSGAAELLKHGQAVNARGDRRVPAHLLIMHLHRMFRLADLISSAGALIRALQGGPYEPPHRMPRTPLLDQEEGVAQDEISLAAIREWVGVEGS